MEKTMNQPELRAYSTRFKMIIPQNVCEKIQHTCDKISTVEWSGTLFYTIEGNFKDKNLTIICKDFFVMDIGSSAYTEFDMSPEVITYMTENPELLDCKMGLIHSHNVMATFFSGTDTATLREEGTDRNHFVSLIVNNAGNYTAAITRKVSYTKKIQADFTYDTFDNQVIQDTVNYDDVNTEIQWFYLDITKESSGYEDLDKRLEELKQKKNSVKTLFENRGENTLPGVDWNSTYSWRKDLSSPIIDSTKGHTVFNDYYNSKSISSGADFNTLKTDEDKINTTVDLISKQLITTSIICPNNDKIDIDSWSKNFPNLWEKRFESIKEAQDAFDEWAELTIEFLLNHALESFNCLDGEDEMLVSEIATSLIAVFSGLDQNYYTKTLLTLFENYIQ